MPASPRAAIRPSSARTGDGRSGSPQRPATSGGDTYELMRFQKVDDNVPKFATARELETVLAIHARGAVTGVVPSPPSRPASARMAPPSPRRPSLQYATEVVTPARRQYPAWSELS